ncbi:HYPOTHETICAL PROTEIN MCJ_006220 [Mesomycoplasma conjunctivae]|uniref:Uncharacterized protein n=1 Tax=Mesomycoplasma conjunctivae (strain ATCC 25834 / NCTC 10147 / HRC/581) TaxID=572263 RepID=C5J754_MESCH|nr:HYPOTHETICAL PROTEIN MCJ_006220 [Mesomycoplasma conjunctivae]
MNIKFLDPLEINKLELVTKYPKLKKYKKQIWIENKLKNFLFNKNKTWSPSNSVVINNFTIYIFK